MKLPVQLLPGAAGTFLVSTAPVRAQSAAALASPTVVLRVYESPSNRIITSYGNGKTETVELPAAYGKKEQLQATEQLQQLVEKLYSEGYYLVSSTSGGASYQATVTYIFRRS